MHKKHTSPQYWDQIKRAKELGFTIRNLKCGQIMVIPSEKSLPFYISHPGEKSIHPLRRFIDQTIEKLRAA